MSSKRKKASRKEEFRKALIAPHALSEKWGREAGAHLGKGCSKPMVSAIGTDETENRDLYFGLVLGQVAGLG